MTQGKEIQPIQNKINSLFARLPYEYKFAFFVTFVVAFLSNLFVFTNNLINADTINESYQNLGLGYVLEQGRWLQYIVRLIGNMYPSPIIHGLFSLLSLSLSSSLICGIFHISDRLSIILLSTLIGVFPINACFLSYIYMADVFYISLLFSILAVYLVERGKIKYFILAAIALMCSIAIYQAFVSITIALIVAIYFFQLLDTEHFRFKKWFTSALRDTLMVVIGYIFYGIITKLLLYATGIPLRTYGGTDKTFSISFKDVPMSILITLIDIKTFYFSTSWIHHKWFLIANVVIAFIFIITMIWTLCRYLRKKQYFTILICIIYYIILPFLIDNIYIIMNMRGQVHMLMHYCYVVPYIMLFVLLPRLFHLIQTVKEHLTPWLKRLSNSLTVLGIVASILIIYFCFIISNQLYCRMSNNMTATNANLTSMLTRIESMEEWDLSTPVYIANARSVLNSNLYADLYFYDEIGSVLWTGTDVYPWGNNGQIYLYLARYFNTLLTLPTDDQQIAIVTSEEFAQMPIFPAEGSIQIIDGVVVVKMEE